MRPNWSLIFGDTNREEEERRREEEEEGEEDEEEEEEEEEKGMDSSMILYRNYLGMDC